MKAPKFSYIRAESVDHALELLDKHGDEGRILAGGQSLMPTLNMRLSQPDILIDINGLDDMKGISLDGDTVCIGALTRHVEVLNSEIVAEHLPLIAEAMPHVAHVAIRNRGTIGGSVAMADPAAEMPACILALGATRIEFATGQDSYLNPDSQIAIDNVAFQEDFGGETVILLFSGDDDANVRVCRARPDQPLRHRKRPLRRSARPPRRRQGRSADLRWLLSRCGGAV